MEIIEIFCFNLKFVRRKKYNICNIYDIFEKIKYWKALKKRDKAIIRRISHLLKIKNLYLNLKTKPIVIKDLEMLNNEVMKLDVLLGEILTSFEVILKKKKIRAYVDFFYNITNDLNIKLKLFDTNISSSEIMTKWNNEMTIRSNKFFESEDDFDNWYFWVYHYKQQMSLFTYKTINEIAKIKKEENFVKDPNEEEKEWFWFMNIHFLYLKDFRLVYFKNCIKKIIKILKKHKFTRYIYRVNLCFFKILIIFKRFLIYERKLKLRSRWIHGSLHKNFFKKDRHKVFPSLKVWAKMKKNEKKRKKKKKKKLSKEEKDELIFEEIYDALEQIRASNNN